MNKLNTQIKFLFNGQLANWKLAHTNYADLKNVQTRSFGFGDFEVKVQFNPARIVSSGAKMDAKTIAARKCFLCEENLPAEQEGIDAGNYTLLVNPFPIFPEHFTIPYKKHIAQQINGHFVDLLELTEALSDYVVFYNGPKCGASAPDHLHFQAGTKNFLPLVADYKRLKTTHAELLDEGINFQLYRLNNYLRTVFCIESDNIQSAHNLFENLYIEWKEEKLEEPMMNIVCSFEDGIWYTFIIPRAIFRPWQYTAVGDQQLLISPAAVEMSGIFITPIESHFERITKEDIVSIFNQTGFPM
jgi:ATP adenylyltransferase/5',5'''-P-1,P-4-tetraphosphate phosphorylase II